MEQRTWAGAEQPAHFVFKGQIFFQITPSFITPEVLIPNGLSSPNSSSSSLYFLGLALLNTKHGVQKSAYEYQIYDYQCMKSDLSLGCQEMWLYLLVTEAPLPVICWSRLCNLDLGY